MANKKKQSNPIYTLSGYAKIYVKNGEPYGLMLTGSYEDENGERHYVNLWKKNKFSVTTAKTGNPALHLGMLEIETINKDGNEDEEEEKPTKKTTTKKTADKDRPKLEEVDELPWD